MMMPTLPIFRSLFFLLAALCAAARVQAEDTPPKCTYVEVASLPIRYVGVGEGIDDLIPFSPHDYVEALFQEKW